MDTGTSVLVGIAVMYFQSWLKRFDFYKAFVKAFPAADKYVHRMIAGLVSLFAAIGITYTMTGDSLAGWVLTLNIPNQATLVDAALTFVKVFIAQQGAYDMTRRPAAMPHDQPAEKDR